MNRSLKSFLLASFALLPFFSCASLLPRCPYSIEDSVLDGENARFTFSNHASVAACELSLTISFEEAQSEPLSVRVLEFIPENSSALLSISLGEEAENEEGAPFSIKILEIRYEDGSVWHDYFGSFSEIGEGVN